MAMKKQNPAVAKRVADRKAFVKDKVASKGITAKQARQRFYVQTRMAEMKAAGKTVILDDRQKVSPGVKFGDAELIGVPQIVIVGKGLETGEVDLWNRRTGERRSVKVESALAELG